MKHTLSYFIGLLLILCSNSTWSQETTAKASLDSTFLLIGNQTKLKLEVNKPMDVGVTFPNLIDTIIREIEVLETSPIDSSNSEDGQTILSRTYTVTSFDTGYHILPAFEFLVNRSDASVDTIKTKQLALEVLLVPVDTSQAIKPIKGPETIPLSWRDWLPWVLGSLLALVLIGVLIFFLTRKKKEEAPTIRVPKEPAHVIALRELDQLKAAKMWQGGDIKGYHSQLTEIIRAYIEHRFQIQALEQTSDQVIRSFEYAGLSNSVPIEELKQLLFLADLVKFCQRQASTK